MNSNFSIYRRVGIHGLILLATETLNCVTCLVNLTLLV